LSESYDLSLVLSSLLKFRDDREWEQFHRPKELATAIGIEASELQEHFLWRVHEDPKNIQLDKERYQGIKEELADIAIYLLYLSHDLDVNLAQAIQQKLKLNEIKYPKNKYKGKF